MLKFSKKKPKYFVTFGIFWKASSLREKSLWVLFWQLFENIWASFWQLLENIWATFWQLLENIWATFYSDIWSHWTYQQHWTCRLFSSAVSHNSFNLRYLKETFDARYCLPTYFLIIVSDMNVSLRAPQYCRPIVYKIIRSIR